MGKLSKKWQRTINEWLILFYDESS